VSSAAPVAAALASGTASEATLSYLYGGSAAEGVSELSMAIPVYEAIGRVCTDAEPHECTAQSSPWSRFVSLFVTAARPAVIAQLHRALQ